MRIRLKPNENGADVERLHRILTSAGFQIEPAEVERTERGPSTLDALHSLRHQRGLPIRDEIDESTLRVRLTIAQNIRRSINDEH
jgi:hypothetical protein